MRAVGTGLLQQKSLYRNAIQVFNPCTVLLTWAKTSEKYSPKELFTGASNTAIDIYEELIKGNRYHFDGGDSHGPGYEQFEAIRPQAY